MSILDDPNDIASYYVYSYEHLDDLRFARKPVEVFEFEPPDKLARVQAAVEDKLKDAGWEGDGELRIIWFPPFVDIGVEDTHGNYVWLVKQSSNGTSWLLSSFPLSFERLKFQNRKWYGENYRKVGCLYTECASFIEKVGEILKNLHERRSALHESSNQIFSSIEEELLKSAQGELVAQFSYFLDGCYLTLLQEIIDDGNQSNLRLQKFKATLSPTKYLPNDVDEGYSEEASQWFTMRGMIGDMWKSFKFEPFNQKMEMVFKTSEYSLPESAKKEIKKHIQLRNCVEHHEGQLTAEAVQSSGGKVCLISEAGIEEELKVWKRIKFSQPELDRFRNELLELAVTFYRHTRQRNRARCGLNSELSVSETN